MLAIVFNQGITINDVVERPINHDFVLLKPKKVLLSFIENSVYLGLLWVNPWRILGSIGVGKIEDVGVDVDPNLQGKTALVLPYSKKYGGIGTEIDGLLAKSAVIPDDALIILPEKFSDKVLLYPFLSMAEQIRDIVKGDRVLILGAGLTGILTYYNIRDDCPEVALYSEANGVISGIKTIKDTDKKWDAIVISSMRSWTRYVAGKLVENHGKIIIPTFMNTWPPVLPKNAIRVYPIKISGLLEEIERKISDKFFEENIGYSDDIISSIPTSKRGVIIDVEKSLR